MKKGRPQGATNRQYDVVDKVITSCRRCGSTDRSEYKNRREVASPVVSIDPKTNREFNVVIYQACQCLECNQWREDRSVELRETE